MCSPTSAVSWFQNAFRNGLSLERVGLAGERQPEIEPVRNDATGAENAYTPGDALRISGAGLRVDPADAAQGVFLQPATGPEVRVTRYLTATHGNLMVLVPASVSGPQTLTVRVKYGTNLRQSVHPKPLTQA